MKIIRTIADMRQFINDRQPGAAIGLVPTMGFLHEGHASLMRKARAENTLVVLSIFVNPLQFGANEDLDRYPRDEPGDLAYARANHVDAVFLPSVEEMYPVKPLTHVTVGQVTEVLDGAARPGHFDGVGVVVSKLFHIITPTRAYFGKKDAQQLAVVQRFVHDLNFPVEIVPCDIVREADGLAKSSRNVYLTEQERAEAVSLSQSLQLARATYAAAPDITASLLQTQVIQYLEEHAPLGEIDYAAIMRYPSFTKVDPQVSLHALDEGWILALAVKFGTTRLIDNDIYHFGGF